MTVRIILRRIEATIGKKKVQFPRLINMSPGIRAIPNFDKSSKIAPTTTIERPINISILASVSNKHYS